MNPILVYRELPHCQRRFLGEMNDTSKFHLPYEIEYLIVLGQEQASWNRKHSEFSIENWIRVKPERGQNYKAVITENKKKVKRVDFVSMGADGKATKFEGLPALRCDPVLVD